MEFQSNSSRVLSLQSHVVSGYVGNRAAVFPQQVLGFDVDFINSVQFSNHTGYPLFKGAAMNGDQLDQLTEGLCSNGLEDYDYLLTGYIGSESFLIRVLHLLQSIESSNPNARYVCDPVLGDNGKYYVPKELVQVFIDRVIPRAFMITPNQFEAELLTGRIIRDEAEAIATLLSLHALGPKIVVLTSAELAERPGQLCCYVLDTLPSVPPHDDESAHDAGETRMRPREDEDAVRTTAVENPGVVTRIIVDKLEGHYTGTGDMTAALMLAWTHILGDGRAGRALHHTIATMQATIRLTHSRQSEHKMEALKKLAAATPEAPQELTKSQITRFSELCVIHSKSFIERPPLEEVTWESWSISIP